MRTLHADLTTAQQAASATPYVKVVFTSRNGATTRTYATTDTPNKLVSVQQAEERYGGKIQSPGGSSYAMVIRVRDADNSIAALDHKGYRCDIDWGFNTTSGNKSSRGPMGFVMTQLTSSVSGTVFVEFRCISVWDLLGYTKVNVNIGSTTELDGTTTVRHALMDLLMGSLGAAISDDGGVQVDQTTESANETTNNVLLFPAAPAVNDAYYFGDAARFNRVSIDLTQVGAGTWTITWEYWNGSNFNTALADIDGNTSHTSGIGAFKTGQLQTFAFVAPSNWATTTVNSQGPFYYVRARISAFTTVSTRPLATKVSENYNYGLALDTSDSLQGDDYTPKLTSDHELSVRAMTRTLLEYTLLGIVERESGFHLIYVDNAQSSPDYTYNTSHTSDSSEKSSELVIPNKIIVVDKDPGSEDNTYNGTAENTASSGELGTIIEIIVQNDIADSTAAALQATRALKRRLRDQQQGSVNASMNCGQEIWDLVSVVDARTGVTFTGRATQILRTYTPAQNIYDIHIQLGGTVAVTRASYLAHQDLTSEAERIATRQEEDARAAVGVSIINRQTIDDIVDAKLAQMEFSPEVRETINFGRTLQEALMVKLAENPLTQGNFISLADTLSLFVTSATQQMATQLSELPVVPVQDRDIGETILP